MNETKAIVVTVVGAPVSATITQEQVREALALAGFRLTVDNVFHEERWDPPGGDGSTWTILHLEQTAPSVAEASLRFAVEALARVAGVNSSAMLTEIAGAVLGEWHEKVGGDPDVRLQVLHYADGAHAALINPTDGWHAWDRDGLVLGSGGASEMGDIEDAKQAATAALAGRKLHPEKPMSPHVGKVEPIETGYTPAPSTRRTATCTPGRRRRARGTRSSAR